MNTALYHDGHRGTGTGASKSRAGVIPAAVLAGVMAMLGWSEAAHGQYALGGGNRLDANPSRVTGRSNLPLPTQDFRARNLIVTGDVAGGRAFRGDVGYTAPGDFRGRLGTDDFFRFQADSAFSSPYAVRTLSEQLRFGQHLGVVEYHRDRTVSGGRPTGLPDGLGVDLDLSVAERSISDRSISDRIRIDQITRAASSSERRMLDGPARTVGTLMDADGQPFLVEASALRGLGYAPALERYQTQGLTPFDRMRLREDMAAGRIRDFGLTPEWRFENLAEQELAGLAPELGGDRLLPGMAPSEGRDERWLSDGLDGRVDPLRVGREGDPERQVAGMTPEQRRVLMFEREIGHRAILESIVRRYAGDEGQELDRRSLRELDEEFSRLRDRLAYGRERDARELRDAEGARDPWALPGEEEADEAEAGERLPERPQQADSREDIDPTLTIPLLRHGQRVDQLTGVERNRFNELMQMAEENLRDGEYFLAERQFIRALQFHPGEPLATAGMAHAQMGAGLYIASSLTLQRLFTTNPEMIDVRYDAGLLPSRARLAQVIESLQQRRVEDRDRAAAAFLLAYIGHQLEDRALVQQSLGVFGQTRQEDDLLYTLLRGIWLGE